MEAAPAPAGATSYHNCIRFTAAAGGKDEHGQVQALGAESLLLQSKFRSRTSGDIALSRPRPSGSNGGPLGSKTMRWRISAPTCGFIESWLKADRRVGLDSDYVESNEDLPATRFAVDAYGTSPRKTRLEAIPILDDRCCSRRTCTNKRISGNAGALRFLFQTPDIMSI